MDEQRALAAPGRRCDQHSGWRLCVEKPGIEPLQLSIAAAERDFAGLGNEILVKKCFGGTSNSTGGVNIVDRRRRALRFKILIRNIYLLPNAYARPANDTLDNAAFDVDLYASLF
jgi:hypothetical protein